MYPSQLDTQGELHFLDIYNLVNKVQYEYFVFPLDSMHFSYVHYDSQFDFCIQEHIDMHFHSEQDGESDSSFYMHCENYFISPNVLMKNSNVFGETNGYVPTTYLKEV